MKVIKTLSIFMPLFLFLKCVHAEQITDRYAPEQSTQHFESSALDLPKRQLDAKSDSWLLATANAYATNAGAEVLSKGGHAVDAMVAVQTVLGLVEPQSSGLGGGAFALLWDQSKKSLHSFDGRETAPIRSDETLFLDDSGKPLPFFEAVVGGRSVGTPGTPKLLWELHQRYGKLPWHDLLKYAEELATNGFIVSPRLSQMLESDAQRLAKDPEAAALFYPNGMALNPGTKLRNPDYAKTLNLLAEHGGDFFYTKDFAQSIVEKVNSHANTGLLSITDFARYTIIERDPICSEIFGFNLCGMGPPSSGAVAINQMLSIAEFSGLTQSAPESVDAWHIISEASRLAFADRAVYLADPAFVPYPEGLLNRDYLLTRAKLVNRKKAMTQANPGQPPGTKLSYIEGNDFAQPSTTHFVIRDQNHNLLSMTSTIENAFGSRVMVNGFLLNNELTDFSFTSRKDGALIANRVEPGKRPRSSMAPTIVFKQGKPVLAIGSPGGSRIINYVANGIIRHLVWGQTLSHSLNAPHRAKRFDTLDLELSSDASGLIQHFETLGHRVNTRDLNSGLHAIAIEGERATAAVDLRREGSARGAQTTNISSQ